MSDLIDFTLGLRDLMTPALTKLAVTARGMFGGLDDDIRKTQRTFDGLSKPMHLSVDTSSLDMAHEKIMGFREIMEGTFAGNMITQGIERAVDFGKDALREVFTSGMDAVKTHAQINVMAGQMAGDQLYGQTKDYIRTSLFGTELFQREKELLGFGESSKNLMKDIKQFGDLSMADEGHFQSLTLALGETLARGHFSEMQERILLPTGFNPIAEYARGTGQSMQGVQDMVRSDKFTADMFRKAMDYAVAPGGRFFEMAKTMEGTPQGKWQLMKTNIAADIEELGVGLMPSVGRLMDAFKPMSEELPGMLEKMQPKIERVIDGFIDMMPSIERFGGGVMDLLKPLGGVLLSDEFRSLSKSVLDIASDLSQTLKPAITQFSGGLKTILGSAADFLKELRGDGKNGTSNHWQWGDPLFESKDQAKQRELYEGNLSGLILRQHAPFFETREQLAKRAMWSAMPDLGFTAHKGLGNAGYMGSSNLLAGYTTDNEKEAAKKALAQAAAGMKESSDAVIGGGRKQIVMNFNAPLYKVDSQVFQRINDAIGDFENKVKEAMQRILSGVPGHI